MTAANYHAAVTATLKFKTVFVVNFLPTHRNSRQKILHQFQNPAFSQVFLQAAQVRAQRLLDLYEAGSKVDEVEEI